eukprot:1087159-Pyramimonas_sp.AAC.1
MAAERNAKRAVGGRETAPPFNRATRPLAPGPVNWLRCRGMGARSRAPADLHDRFGFRTWRRARASRTDA